MPSLVNSDEETTSNEEDKIKPIKVEKHNPTKRKAEKEKPKNFPTEQQKLRQELDKERMKRKTENQKLKQ